MREIKFRAWNKKASFMDSAWMIDWEHGHVCHSKHNQSDLEDCILMQYTGLKDKNGKEICEGDVFRTSLGHVAVVEWDDENGRFLAFTATRRIMYVGREPAVEIIGNIYENPELLNA